VDAREFPGRVGTANGIARQFNHSNNPATFKIKSIRLIAPGLKIFAPEFSIEIAPNRLYLEKL
jgi:hypothetical protein